MTDVAARSSGPPGVVRPRLDVLGAIAIGGALGALARYGLAEALPRGPGAFPWATLIANAAGCLLIGVLMVLVERGSTHRLARPFLGVGVLGGFTTFSTFAVETDLLAREGTPETAMLYLVATPAVALAAVGVGIVLTRLVVTRPPVRR